MNSPRSLFQTWTLRLATGIAGTAFILLALIEPRFRDTEGFLTGIACLLISSGAGFWVLAIFTATDLRQLGSWLALAILGNAAALQMIEAGKSVRYQHYLPPGELLSGVNSIYLGILVVQALLVAVGIWRYAGAIYLWVTKNFRTWQLILLAALFALTSTALSRNAAQYAFEMVFATFVQLVNLGNLFLMVAAIPAGVHERLSAGINRLLGDEDRWITRALPWLAGLWVFGLCALLSLFVYQRHPHVQDEVMYLFQARYLAQGQISVPAPLVPEAFTLYMVPYEASRWYSIFPPGWPAILAVGVLFSAPWLVNPALAGINVWLTAKFIQEIYSRRIALVSVLLLMFSPWYLFLGMSFMAHMATLSCGLIAALGLLQARKQGNWLWALLAGAMVGATSLIRLQDGFVVGLLLGLLALGIGGRRLSLGNLVAFALAVTVVTGLNFVYNNRLMGSPTNFPLNSYYDEYYGPKSNAFGFGPERGLDWPLDAFPGHTPLEAALNALLNAFSINVELFGWGMGSLLLASLFVLSLKMNGSDYWMLAVIAAVVGVLSLYWFSGGPDFGARYWFLLFVPVLALTVRGLQLLEDRLRSTAYGNSGKPVTIAVICLCVISLINYFPWRSIDKYFHYLGMRPDIRTLAKNNDFGKSLVLVKGKQFLDYQSAWVYNPLDPQADAPVYAWDKSPEVRSALLEAYYDRLVWIVEGPSLTGQGYRVVDGPVPAKELLLASDRSP